MLSITELTDQIKKSAKTHTHKQRISLLKQAHILDESGQMDRFFSTVPRQEVRVVRMYDSEKS